MANIENLIFHCSASDFGDVELIRQWHTLPPRNWRDIGYNGVILNGKRNPKDKTNQHEIGIFEQGRGLDFDKAISPNESGAHTLSYNKNSIGICMIGDELFEKEQFITAVLFARLWQRIVPEIKIFGHYELPTAHGKTCPNFDMSIFREIVSNDSQPLHYQIENKLSKYLK